MDPVGMKELIIGATEIAKMRGGKKEAAEEEKVTIDFAFATVVAIKDIKKGHKFTKENLWVKRPGTGEILAEEYNSIIGRVAANDIQNDNHYSTRKHHHLHLMLANRKHDHPNWYIQ